MSRRGRREGEEEEETLTASTRKSEESGNDPGEFNPDAEQYGQAIKEANEEKKQIFELRQKEAKGEKLDDDDKEKLRNTVDEEARLNNKIAQLRSEASRKGIELTV